VIQSRLMELGDVCRKRRVRRLYLFGSAAGKLFDPTTSDLDLLVEFEPMTPVQHADYYFGLMDDLQRLFGRRVDLVEVGSIRNPYFLRVVESNRELIYAAA